MAPLTGRLPLALLVAAVAGCMPTVHVFPLDDTPPVAVSTPNGGAHPVRFYLHDAPRCPFVPVARLTVTPFEDGDVLWTEQVADRLRTKARALGADAVVGLDVVTFQDDAKLVHTGSHERSRDSTRSRAVVAETTSVQYDRRERLEGMAVRWKEEGCRE
jgi:hypothetical protein